MKRTGMLCVLACCVVTLCAQEKENARLKESYNVLKDIQGSPDKGIPKDLLDKASCVLVFPSVKKAGFVIGAQYGRGAMTCRSGADYSGAWTAPG